MLPAAVVDSVLQSLVPLLEPGDIVIEGGNSYYHDDIRRAGELRGKGLHYVDVGVSGGVWGLERGYCHMIGGEDAIVRHLDPIFRSLAPGVEAAPRTPGATGEPSQAEFGYLHCGPNGAGHFVKMVHNGIEYGLMAAYAEGLQHHPAMPMSAWRSTRSMPRRRRCAIRSTISYEIDVAQVAEVWRRGSVVASWLLDLTAGALRGNADLANFHGRVSDSGEGRWTVHAAIDEGVPAPVISAALYARFASRGDVGLCRPAAVGDALRLRRPCREARREGVVNGRPAVRRDRLLRRHRRSGLQADLPVACWGWCATKD